MSEESKQEKNPFFIETKMGVVTQKGDWFHINAEKVDDFAPGLLEHVSFLSLIKEAQAWIDSTSSLSLILLYILLFFINPWIAAGVTVVFHFLWYHNKSAFVVNKAYKIFRVTNSTVFLFIIALVCLSAFAIQQHYLAFGVGLFFFFVLKPGLLKKGWNRLNAKRSSRGLSLNDRLLKMIIIKHVLYTESSSPEEVAEMENRLTEFISKVKGN